MVQDPPGEPGPFAPVYEKAVSDEGIATYALMHGLVIAARTSELARIGEPSGTVVGSTDRLRRDLPAKRQPVPRQPVECSTSSKALDRFARVL